MSKIKKFEEFNEQQILDFIENSINESLDISKIWKSTIEKIKNFSYNAKKRIINSLLISIMSMGGGLLIQDLIQQPDIDLESKQIAISIIDTLNSNESQWRKGYEFKLSQKGWDHIKDEEKLRLKAYSIGDGMVTIGWGHAEPVEKSKYRVGDVIDREEAFRLLKDDLKEAADGVRNIFIEWERKNINVEINQDMFDALVSISFNSGIGSLRKSDFIQDIKRQDFKSAGEKIKTFKVTKNFPGLEIRRNKESQMFLASL